MKRKTSLSAALQQATGRAPASDKTGAQASPARTVSTPSGREGKRPIAGFFDPAVSRQLKQLGLDKEKTMQELLREAINDLFEKYGLSRIA